MCGMTKAVRLQSQQLYKRWAVMIFYNYFSWISWRWVVGIISPMARNVYFGSYVQYYFHYRFV